MELHSLALFWRDQQACCFTSFRFYDPVDPLKRARKMAKCMETLSTLQLYCVIANLEILTWNSTHVAPPAGTEQRVEIALYPSQPLNARAGITTIKISIPGPNTPISEIFTVVPPNFSHSYWKMLEHEIMPWLRLPNGLTVTPAVGAARIQRTRLVEIAEQYRPQPGRPPVDAALSATIRRLDEERSRLSRTQRANQPIEFELAKVERYQRQLAYLQTLHRLEQSVWLKVNSSEKGEELLCEEIKQSQLLTLIIDKTRYLPTIPDPVPTEWADVPAQDFVNPDLWEHIGQLKNKFAITSNRSFRRAIAHLKSLGLRTLPARQDARLRLFYRPDAANFTEMIAKKSVQNALRQSNLVQQPTISSNQLAEIWQAIRELQAQQRNLQDAINKLCAVEVIAHHAD